MSVEREPKFQTPAPSSSWAGAQWSAWSCCETFESIESGCYVTRECPRPSFNRSLKQNR